MPVAVLFVISGKPPNVGLAIQASETFVILLPDIVPDPLLRLHARDAGSVSIVTR